MTKTLAIITARGGSKRIPRKNVKPFAGKPIICYSIEAALNAGCFSEVMVSTDDMEIAELARRSGASVPFMRSEETAGDFATTADVVEEVLLAYSKAGKEFRFACCVYPTAPFVTPEKLRDAFERLLSSGAQTVMPVVRFGFPILRSLKMENGYVSLNWPEYMNVRSQDLSPAFHDAGQFYFLSVEDFLRTKKIFAEKTIGVEMPETEVQDIDNEEDWKLAEVKYEFLLNRYRRP